MYRYVGNNPINWADPSGYIGGSTLALKPQPQYPEDPSSCCGSDPYGGVSPVKAGADIGITVGSGVGALVGGVGGFAVCGPACAYLGAIFGGIVGGSIGGALGADIGSSMEPAPPKGKEFCYGAWANQHENDAAIDGLLGGLGGPIVYRLPPIPL